MIRTTKYAADEKAGRFLHSGFGTTIEGALGIATPDSGNIANISVLPIRSEQRRELLAIWEAGSPWRVDPDSLETLGRKVWSPQTDGVAFSAHPIAICSVTTVRSLRGFAGKAPVVEARCS